MFALTAGAAGTDSTFAASSLKASGSWAVGLQSGSFDYTYPITAPPSTGGEAPELALSYSSSRADGYVANENGQASQVGLGWELPIPFIERKFADCTGNDVGSKCWAGENATISIDGKAATLVQTGADADVTSFAMDGDQGYRIERVYGYGDNVNGDDVGFYWKVTDTSGTQYFFGRENTAWQTSPNNSTLSMPVLHWNPGDPCYGGWFTCTMAWRWNLSYIVDANGNIQTYRYQRSVLTYEPWPGTYWDYDGDGVLLQVGYGRRTDTVKTGGPAQKIELAYRWRCNRLAAGIPATQCDDGTMPDPLHPEWYPDIPFDIACWAFNGSSNCDNGPPHEMVFYSLRRLDATFTYVRQASGSFQQVDTTFISGDYQMVGTDYSTASLTLNSVWRVGADNATELPRTEFGYTILANRWAGGDITESGRPRLTEVLTDLGGRIRPSYGQPDPCSAFQNQQVPKWQNASDCFYVGRADGTHDHYKKYLVSQVQILDRDGSPTQTTSYGYSVNPNQNAVAPEGLGAGWHSDNQIVTPLAKQGWNQFRGYQTVTVQQTRASGTPAKEITTFFRGLHGDHTDLNNTTATRTVNVTTAACPAGTPASATSTCNVSTPDSDALRGKVYEHRILDGAGMEQSADQHTYTVQTIGLSGAPVENRPWGSNTHPIMRVGESTERSLFYDTSLPRNRQQTITRSFDTTYARVIWEQDSGDAGTGIGVTCTWTTWNTDPSDWVLDAERRTVRANGTCGGSEPTGSVVIERREYLYDNLASGTVGAGNVTQDLVWTGPNGNVTAPNQYAATKYTYDVFGHVTGVQSPNNYGGTLWKTTAYTTTSGPVTAVTSTNELNHTSTTTLDPRWGVPLIVTDANTRVTTLGYDTFGRLTSVLRPGDTVAKPSTTYAYTVNQWAPSVIATTNYPTPTAAGITSYAYLDSLGRTFQAEEPSPTSGQRIITGAQFDDQGNPAVAISEFIPSPAGTPGTPVANFYDSAFTNALPSRTQTSYDELDRPTAVALKTLATTVWTSSTAYNGFTTTATPASNGTNGPALYATATTKDLYGRVKSSVIKRGSPSDVSTTYTYDTAGDLKTITSPKGAVTSYTYDWAGNRTQTIDPDAGTSIASYSPGGQVSYAKDGANLESWTTLDAIGRVTKIETGPSASKVLTVQNTYDTALKGTLASATRYEGADAFTEATTYDIRYRAASVTRSIPAALLGGTGTQSWTTSTSYDQLDRPLTLTYPAAGGLAAETVTSAYAGAYATTMTTNLAGSPAYVSATGYTNIGQAANRTLGTAGATGSLKRGFGYETATGRLASVTGNTPSTATTNTVQNQTFAYANTGEVTSITNTVDNQRECYTYDGLSRLTLAGTTATSATACTPDMATGPNPYKETYAYDDDGNLTQLVRSTSPTAATTWNYTYGTTTLGTTTLTGGPHALTVVKNGATATNGYSYDTAGRQISKTNGSGTSPVASTWNSVGQLATVNGANNAFTYGPDGSRWIRKTVSGTTTTTTVYLPGQEVKRAVTGTTPTTSGVRYYSHDDEVVATRSTTNGLTWTVSNYQNSNTTAVNATTAAITRDRYTPYGLNRATSSNTSYTLPGATGTDRGWLGQTRDDTTGLDYLSARYYDPSTAHFISPDPLNNVETPQAANPYTYADDNPSTLTDPTGLAATQYWNRRVQPGDNWNLIADHYNVSLSQLRAWNGSLSALKVGQSIIVGIRSTSSSASGNSGTTTGSTTNRAPAAASRSSAAKASTSGRAGAAAAVSTACSGQVRQLTCTTANRAVTVGSGAASVVQERNAILRRQAAKTTAKLRATANRVGGTSGRNLGLAVDESAGKTLGNLKAAATTLKWVARGSAVLGGAVSAWSVYEATGSVWRAAGAGVANAGMYYLLGVGAGALIASAGLALLPAVAVVGVAVGVGIIGSNLINRFFSR